MTWMRAAAFLTVFCALVAHCIFTPQTVNKFVRNEICPDNNTQCPSGETCCQQNKSWVCCPQPKAVCCKDEKTCCPADYKCDPEHNTCSKNDKVIPAIHEWKPPRDVICPDGHMCNSGSTCCPTGYQTFGCCPEPNAVCCMDGKHCCPAGTKCDQSGECFVNITVREPLKKENINSESILCPDSMSWCGPTHKCCPVRGGLYGCCPESFKCNPDFGTCTRSMKGLLTNFADHR